MSRQLMTAFLRANHLWEDLSECVVPRHPLLADASPYATTSRIADIADLDALSTLILELEQGQRGVPILLKHYLRLGGRLLGFNIDPQFSNVVDGFILLDLLQAPPRLMEKYVGPQTIQALDAYHRKSSSVVVS